MDGFFSRDQIQIKPKVSTIPSCGLCKLHKVCKSPTMRPTGEGKKGILFIAEAPGEDEDERGIQLIGRAGQLHRKTLKKLGVDLDKDCRKTNAIICRPPKNRTPTPKEIEHCRPNLLKEIRKNPPKLIVPMGNAAVASLLGHRWKHGDLGGITRWRGFIIPDRELSCWIAPTFHPSFILRNEHNKAVKLLYENDLKTAIYALENKRFPTWEDEQKLIRRIIDPREAKKFILDLIKMEPPLLAVDYETTGLKPHAKGHEIVSLAFSYDSHSAVSMLYQSTLKNVLRRLYGNKNIGFIAANAKYEKTWTKFFIGTDIENVVWDTMLNAHCLDNRQAITGLKFQTYVRYGLIDYDSHISHLLRSKGTHANEFNQIHKIKVNDLLTYGGMDALLEYRLAMDQMREMGIVDPVYYFSSNEKKKGMRRPNRKNTTPWNLSK